MKFVILLSLLSTLTMACMSETSAESTPENSDTLLVDTIETVLNTGVNYAEDWEGFKRAARTQDMNELKAYCTENITDFQGLSYLLSELHVMRGLDETTFKELESVDVDGTKYLQFYAEDVGMDEEGYEMGTSLTLFFLKTEKGLRLDRYFAAG